MPQRLALQLHPDSRCEALTGIDVEFGRLGPRRILLRYFLHGEVRHVRLPRAGWSPPQRRDGLWRHTCFEAFLRAGDDRGYYEFNLSSSGDWAAYRFSGYRAGMEPAKEIGPPGRDPGFDPPRSTFAAVLELDRLAALPLHEAWQLGISAVIEERNGSLSYWALAHPPGAPDFHHPDCFAARLAPARPA